MQEELSILIQAQYPLIYLVTSEEERAESAIALIATHKPEKRIFVWTLTRGIIEYGEGSPQHGTIPPQQAFEFAIRHKEPAIFVFKDLHPFLQDGTGSAEVVRWIRDAIAAFKGTKKTIILMSPFQQIPIELEKEVAVLDFALPSMTELETVLARQLIAMPGKHLETEVREKLVKAALGLTKDEAEKVYRKASVTANRLTGEEVEIILSEKKQLIRRNGIL